MQPTLMSGEFHDTAIGRQRSTQDREATGRLERRLDGDDDPLAVGRDGVRADLGEGPAIDRGRTAVEQAGSLQQFVHHQTETAGFVHVGRGEPAPGLQVGHDRRPVGDRAELVDVELETELVRDRQ